MAQGFLQTLLVQACLGPEVVEGDLIRELLEQAAQAVGVMGQLTILLAAQEL